MADRAPPPPPPPAGIDSRSGFCAATRIFHSTRAPGDLPPESLPMTAAAYAFSLLSSSTLPGSPALVDAATGIAISYPSFLAAVRSLAGGLWCSLGLRPGDVALVVAPSRLEVPVLDFALMSIGAVVSPANPVSTPEEYAHQVALSRPVVAFAAPEVAAKLPGHVRCVVIGSDEYGRLAASDGRRAAAPAAVAVKQSDTAAVLYSSGTTGRVKAVAITHRNLIALMSLHADNREKVAREAAEAGEEPPPPAVTLLPIPLFHVFGFMMVLRSVSMGETSVLMERFDFIAALRAIERYRVTLLPAAPPVLVAMVKYEEARRRDLSSLLVIGIGGAPLGREVAEQFASVFPNVELVQGYGLTESSGAVAATVGPEESKAYGSVGKLGSHLQAKIVDPSTGYVGDDEATAATVDSEGWLKTGDLCYFNEDGFLYIVDRLKELIKYKGYQVPPAELEHILQSHPGIADAAVIPYPDEEAGELPMAFIVRQPGSNITKEQVMDYVAKQVAPYKKVRRVAFVTAIPKSPAGKILRRELVQQALSMGCRVQTLSLSHSLALAIAVAGVCRGAAHRGFISGVSDPRHGHMSKRSPPPQRAHIPMAEQRWRPPYAYASSTAGGGGVDRRSRSGFCAATRTFHSLRSVGPLPPEELPLTVAAYAFSLLSSAPPLVVAGRGPALVDAATGIAVSYPAFVARVRFLAGGLWCSLGLRPGDVALVVSPSCLDVAVLYFALMSIGVVVSPANPASTADEYAHQVRLSRPAVAFVAPEVAARLPRHVSRVVIGSEVFDRLASASAAGGWAAPPAVAMKQSSTAALLYSSGTTGRVKAVAITHRNLIAQISAYNAIRETVAREAATDAGKGKPPPPSPPAAVTLFPLPLFHVMGFGLLTRTISSGETAVVMRRFDLAAAARAVERYRVTKLSAAPPVVVALTKSDEARRRDLSSLVAIVVGSAPLGREVSQRFATVFPSSTGPVATMAGPEELAAYGSVGRLAPRVQAKIVDTATGEALGPGRRGELWIRGPVGLCLTLSYMGIFFSGYVGDPEATAATITPDGWLKTGDLCYFNEDGYLYVVDRLKELIKYKGYQVPPAELEHILQSRPEIADAAVVPYPDEEAGQLPMAFVVRQPGAYLTEQQVMNCVAKHVAPYKKVRRVAFVNAIPKSPAGKILRRELVLQAMASTSRL
uniref:4-coumarate--CoA ligase n=1 Tax=Oryza glumipatula TaxID=40148 RepID=A0A0D9YIR3_9ORYZ